MTNSSVSSEDSSLSSAQTGWVMSPLIYHSNYPIQSEIVRLSESINDDERQPFPEKSSERSTGYDHKLAICASFNACAVNSGVV